CLIVGAFALASPCVRRRSSLMNIRFGIVSATMCLALSVQPAIAQHAAERGGEHLTPPRYVESRSFTGAVQACGRGSRQHSSGDSVFGCGGDGWAYTDSEWALYNNRSWA